jgi:hypothetical protein
MNLIVAVARHQEAKLEAERPWRRVRLVLRPKP